MKNIGTRVFAAILVIWYSLSLIGFGVHTCSENNRSFLTSFISGVSCEDVHPEELCGNACCEKVSYKHSCKCCCGHIVEVVEETAPESVPSDGCVLAQKKCCSDDYQQIEITGSGQSESSEKCLAPLCVGYCDTSSLFSNNLLSCSKDMHARVMHDRRVFLGELRPLLSIWRI